jgi:2-polyprenyl-6-methoxyphenol hydroxylase-like FAD-dependent oxidoreductase
VADLERILIVGGGIAGLTLATALHQQGFTAELVERSPTWQTMGAGIMLHGNGVRILRTLGMSVDVEQAGTNLHSWSFCDQQGELLCEIDLQALWGEVGPTIGIARTELQQVLRTGAADVTCRVGIALTSLTQHEQRVRVDFSDGSSGDYDLVVGADGLGSTVRRLALEEAPPGYTGLMVWRSLAPHHQPSMQVLLGEGCVFGLVPVGNGQTYGFGIEGSPRFHAPLEGRLERVRHRFAAFGGAVPAYLASLSCDEQLHCVPIEWVDLEQWYHGRVVLIGDAAHDGPPMMAQGGCMAMENAWVLADVLRQAESVESALDSYASRRRPPVAWVQQESRAWAESYRLPPVNRSAAVRERGEQVMQDRFRPLIPVP